MFKYNAKTPSFISYIFRNFVEIPLILFGKYFQSKLNNLILATRSVLVLACHLLSKTFFSKSSKNDSIGLACGTFGDWNSQKSYFFGKFTSNQDFTDYNIMRSC